MIVDTSAIASIFFHEPNHKLLLNTLLETNTVGIGAPTLVECGIVLSARLGEDARGLLSRLQEEVGFVVIPFSQAHYGVAVGAWLQYGKGRHPAQLNFGDCMSYATAKLANQPLLFIGDDFSQTDIEIATILTEEE